MYGSCLNKEHVKMIQQIYSTAEQDLRPCGPAVLQLFNSIKPLYIGHPPQDPQDQHLELEQITSSLIRLADERILSYHYKDVPTCWRQLHTDASLLQAILTVVSYMTDLTPEEQKSRFLKTIRQLDLVIIVAGAPGQGRYELVLDLIKRIQKRYTKVRDDNQPRQSPAKRRKLSEDNRKEQAKARPRIPSSPMVDHPIISLRSFPSFESYLELYHKEPFIVSGGSLDWPANELWCDQKYLQEKAGVGRCVPVEVGKEYTEREWRQEILPFEQVLNSVFEVSEYRPMTRVIHSDGQVTSRYNLPKPVHYLAQHDLFRQIPDLRNDILIPDIVYSAPPEGSKECPEYVSPKNEDGYVLNAWLGPKGTLSPAHTDPYYNCYAQVVGSKWIWVAPPSCSPAMSAFGLSSSTEDPTSDETEDDDQSPHHSHLLTNTSRIDVSSPDTYDAAFKEQVVPFAQQAVLQKGDVLVLPPGWWHSLKGLEVSFSVSIWF
ncbi:hypothetical protein MVLG_05380 [Microbotryum lychnidis-dioicae p1A1 Lamole]|uniref:JmjC domain-containing protein n=1 Tax=Microbotryum lychnidis-dioicae (strain p1A1 Lamole / MvSl-1064) TaxID=683840 RepID=U5HE30_USTV1|nr:hypothetical protein MVLG_05380 [Microbotryum lychnidis-dioicae p1A1 Lamole]|eukprot:KDE04154.1 hypothetical protein MVLG_05380 [Microbotryum lychnidis-dioicae p1A1 Lamole]